MGSDSLYRKLLGSEFDLLPEILQSFHSRDGRAEGTFEFMRSPGIPRHILASCIGLPYSRHKQKGRLSVTTENEAEVWDRQIGEWRFRTRQTLADGLLVEEYGPLKLFFLVRAAPDRMVFEQIGCKVCGLRIPKYFWITVDATVVADLGHWHIDVRLGAPVVGELCRYNGRLKPV